jgi:hypothetical protein
MALAAPVAVATLPRRAEARGDESLASSTEVEAPHDPALLHPPIAALREILLPIGLSPAVVYRALPAGPLSGQGR